MAAGYSGTPLGRKLGLKDGMRVLISGMPPGVRAEALAGIAVEEVGGAADGIDLVHIFSDSRAAMAEAIASARGRIRADGMIWASWPKKASGVPTDIAEDTIRDIALPMGLVDVKVCAVDAVWSGLKLVIRKELRGR